MLHSATEEWLASGAMLPGIASNSVVRSSSWGLVRDDNNDEDGGNPTSAVLFLAKQANDAIRWLASNTTTSINETSSNSSNNSSNSSSGGNSTNTTGDGGGGASASTVLRDTFLVYGIIFGVMLLLFCCVRVKFPRPYTIRRWVDDIKVGFRVLGRIGLMPGRLVSSSLQVPTTSAPR
jgi:hypothetical protein